MPIAAATLRPGLLVSLRTTIKGNVSYNKQVIEPDHVVDNGDAPQSREAAWNTKRRIEDAAEHQLAVEVRGRVRTVIGSVCASGDFGLICPQDREARLDEAIAEARELAQKFNATAKITTVRVSIYKGRVAADDVEAVRSINANVRELLATMEEGLKNLDVQVVRDAATKAREIGQILTEQAQERIQGAVEAVRSAARKIVKAGEQAAIEIDAEAIKAITEARTAFLDLEGNDEVAAPVEDGRALDLAPSEIIAVAAPAAPQIELEA